MNLGHLSSFTMTPKVPSPPPFVFVDANTEDDIFIEKERDAANFFREMRCSRVFSQVNRYPTTPTSDLRLKTSSRSGGSKPELATGI